MKPDVTWQEHLWRGLAAVMALLVPSLVAYTVYDQIRMPAFVLALDWQTGVIREVNRGSLADTAGFWPGDIVLTVDGAPLNELSMTRIENVPVEIERDGQRLTLELPVVPIVTLNLFPLVSSAIVALAYWGSSVLLLVRRSQQKQIRLIFLAAQTLAITLLLPIAYNYPRFMPQWALDLSVACLFLSAPLILHHCVTFPIELGAPRQRRWVLSLLYALALLNVIAWFGVPGLGTRPGAISTALVIAAALVAAIYVYVRRASSDDRRRLRLILFSTLLAGGPPLLFYLAPAILNYPYHIPLWMIGFFTLVIPPTYLYAILQHNLFGIDHLLNRALVHALLSLSILLLYLGPFVLIYRFRPNDMLAQMMVAAGLTLLVGLSFDWTRTRVQRWVDLFFYGGWYDYPHVVETISDALAHCIKREQLTRALTHQTPAMMQLNSGQLYISQASIVPPPAASLQQMQFPLTFQGQIHGVWIAGPRRDGQDLSDADRRILKTLARQAETALGNVLLVEALRRQLEEIRASREILALAQRQLLRSREAERARLARELHDGPLQNLIGLNMQLGLLLASDKVDTPVTDELEDMRAKVQYLLADLRQVCAELRPPMLDTLGLGAALRALSEDWSVQHNIPIRLDLPADAALRVLPGEAAVNIYRVAQEALTNVARHAQAHTVNLSLHWDATHLTLTIQDDGQGFVLPDVFSDLAVQGHFGLVGIQERVNLIGGQLAIESSPHRGATVRITWQTTNEE